MRCSHNFTGNFCPICLGLLLSTVQKPVSEPRYPPVHCTHLDNCLTETGYGTRICMQCGIEAHGGPFCKEPSYMYPRGHELTIRRKQPYTRAKRFRKYLLRACMSQGLSSVPDGTWRYLQSHKPYSGPREILFRLKRSKLDNKCYDSLPIMTKHMCPHLKVPEITYEDTKLALRMFDRIELGFPKGSKFVSYLYLLEHILVSIGRQDMLPFLNRIQCPKRRRQYEERIRLSTSSGCPTGPVAAVGNALY